MTMYDFYADTKTKPTAEMRKAVLECAVGDEQKDEDPTTSELCARVAKLLGKEAAVFLPSGTMCNEIAIKVHTNPGDEVICEQSCHIINFETGGPAAISGVMIRAIEGSNGIFTADQVRACIRPNSRYMPESTLLCVEQTANMGGGAIWPLEQLDNVAKAAKDAGLATHMDGARLMNAVAKTGIPAARYAQHYDTVWIDFTKGLGAPVGAVLAGTQDFIVQAWRLKQRLGGAMRQSGIVASMCLYALDHHVDRLAEDNDLAAHLGQEIAKLPMVSQVLPVETNIVIFDLTSDAPNAAEVVEQLKAEGILTGAFGERRIRVVTHIDVNPAAGEVLLQGLSKLLGTPKKEEVFNDA
ncbi:threonine aldolase family protein [Leisingera sp. MMG026]|uniref:threonine aldolase family protein n=1 Tax=Leisingera sp. MMG026 TaxID=2909982 RepID=UPI001F18A0C0|nr:threonine aldolase family protein [Leisingera sp. MMG026]MCF6432961.1 threonine aldolase family protein [Leisingera sp. MMG026]